MSKARGNYYERALTKAFKDQGLEAWRVPLSGALGESAGSTLPDRVKVYLIGDVCVRIGEIDTPIEVKFRSGAAGFTDIYKYPEAQGIQFQDCTLLRGVDAFVRFRSGLADVIYDNSNTKLLNTTLTSWLDQCKVLALRSSRQREWYFICI